MSVSREEFSVGKAGFVAEHGLFDEEQQAAVKEVTDRPDGSDLKHGQGRHKPAPRSPRRSAGARGTSAPMRRSTAAR